MKKKKVIVNLSVLLLAFLLTPFTSNCFAISFGEARHLLARTGFGTPSPAEIDAIITLNYEDAVDNILNNVITEAITQTPNFESNPLDHRKVKHMDARARKEHNKKSRKDRKLLRFWWIQEMIRTPSPFTERMVLFWHNHFVSEINKVQYAEWALEQNATFRKHAISNFRKLLIEVSTGPAMMKYLDTNKNKKNKPNENFAREILELFTLGEGKVYTEKDIRESARAYTGWQIDYKTANFAFKSWAHDKGLKSVLGNEGHFDGFDVIEIILEEPRVAEFLTEKLWREFVSLIPSPKQNKKLSRLIIEHNYDLKPMLKSMLMSKEFRDPQNRGSLIKSPVDLTIGTLRLLGLTSPKIKHVWRHQKKAGQDLFQPPDVKGWRGGKAWITSTTTLNRANFLKKASEGFMKYRKNEKSNQMQNVKQHLGLANPWPLQKREIDNPGYLRALLLAVKPIMQRRAMGKHKTVIRNLLLDPAYQVK